MAAQRAFIRLDALKNAVGFVPINTGIMDQAAAFWAQARKMGKPTASDAALDGDMILSAHAAVLSEQAHDVIVATTNINHLEIFCDARLWTSI